MVEPQKYVGRSRYTRDGHWNIHLPDFDAFSCVPEDKGVVPVECQQEMPRAFETAVQPRHVQHRSNRLEAANIAVSNMVLIRCSLRTNCETLLSVIFITIYSVLENGDSWQERSYAGKSETDINLDYLICLLCLTKQWFSRWKSFSIRNKIEVIHT